MTLKEKVKQEQQEVVDKKYTGGVEGCPHHYPYLNVAEEDEFKMCQGGEYNDEKHCFVCWNQKYKEVGHE